MSGIPLELCSSVGGRLSMARYNFEPEGMDKNGGTIDVDSASVSIEFPSIAKEKNKKSYYYEGTIRQSNESEFVLIIDSETGVARIQKLDSCINLRNVRKSLLTPSSGCLQSPPKKFESTESPEPISDTHVASHSDELDKLEVELLQDLEMDI